MTVTEVPFCIFLDSIRGPRAEGGWGLTVSVVGWICVKYSCKCRIKNSEYEFQEAGIFFFFFLVLHSAKVFDRLAKILYSQLSLSPPNDFRSTVLLDFYSVFDIGLDKRFKYVCCWQVCYTRIMRKTEDTFYSWPFKGEYGNQRSEKCQEKLENEKCWS